MLEIASLTGGAEARLYRDGAERILTSLTERYASFGPEREYILREGTGHKPAGQNINVGLIYGDYFYVEAVSKLRGWGRSIF
ncbi:hypothetical protein LJK87_35850 [Paenibacillus sp. P25]|nr:hypothetical protein LJK87_35850 [Paenibacillus sp. P25]